VRGGDMLAVGGGQFRQIQELVPESFNSANQVGIGAHFTDGTTGAYIVSVPEPSFLFLLSITVYLSPRRSRNR
jgi:hypothetical protein